MDCNMEHEDLLIKLRAKLNEGKIKLWEPPYLSNSGDLSQSFKELANRFASELSLDVKLVCSSLQELQNHSVERCKANEEYKETGCATLRVKVIGRGEKRIINVMKTLSVMGSELINTVAETLAVDTTRLKLIFNGKVIKPTPTLEEQGVKNGVQLMALVMEVSPDAMNKENDLYKRMKATLKDATLLSESCDDPGEESYMNLEDQSGKSIELPKSERKSMFIGLALHETGRTCIKKKEYSLALVLLLEADRQLSSCRAQVLGTVDNFGVLQLDVAWCYLCLRSLPAAADAAARLARAERAFRQSYGPGLRRLLALAGTDANQRVLFMRLYLMQGIVAYHQNMRQQARDCLDRAERELVALRVDETSVQALMELGWSRSQASSGLRAARGDLDRAHLWLDRRRQDREIARKRSRDERQRRRALEPLEPLVEGMQRIGFPRELAASSLQDSDCPSQAVRLIQDQPELLDDSDVSEEDETPVEPDDDLLEKLKEMGYDTDDAASALQLSGNEMVMAMDILQGWDPLGEEGAINHPSTSDEAALKRKKRKLIKKYNKKVARELAISRLRESIRSEEDDYLSSTLSEEEQFLAQYKSLL